MKMGDKILRKKATYLYILVHAEKNRNLILTAKPKFQINSDELEYDLLDNQNKIAKKNYVQFRFQEIRYF